jgi:radical SAM superfamily enzyme YgiQ (UPF0313 family)
MAAQQGYEVVLTASRAVMSNYQGNQGMGLSSAFPYNPLMAPFVLPIFSLQSDANGRMLQTHLGLGKIEAALLNHGFTQEQVIIADPTKLSQVIGQSTRVVGITCLDPLGLGYGVKVTSFLFHRLGLPYSTSIIAYHFRKLILDPTLHHFRQQGQLQIMIGGPGVWQIADSKMQDPLGVDCIVEGEGEAVVPQLVQQALNGNPLPRRVTGTHLQANSIPLLRTPSRCGIVEITRGCGRGCQFCYPTQLPFRSFPVENILHEIRLNQKAGIPQVSLHSDDALRYGSKTFEPNPEAVLHLLQAVKEEAKGTRFGFDFFSVASIMQNPQLLAGVAHLMGLGGRRFSTVEVGIETGSPNLLGKYMRGKVKPFQIKEWPELVRGAAQLLHDHQWITCYSIILGLPGETADDVQRTAELVDDLKKFNCVIIPIIFMPAGGFRRSHNFGFEDMSPEQWDLYSNCMELVLTNASLFLTHSLSSRMKSVVNRAIYFGLSFVRKKIRQLRWKLRPSLYRLKREGRVHESSPLAKDQETLAKAEAILP